MILQLLLVLVVVSMATGQDAIATIVDKDEYAVGAVVLARSLRATSSIPEGVTLVAIVPQNSLRALSRQWLVDAGWSIRRPVDPPKTAEDLPTSGRTDLDALIEVKLSLWALIEFDRVLYMDCDAFALHSTVHWWDARYWRGKLSAIQEIGGQDIFKGGLLALKPSLSEHERLVDLLHYGHLEFVNADQGFLNIAFKDEWANKPQVERFQRADQLCAAYCVVQRSFQAEYDSILNSAVLFDFQGRVKPWAWPLQINVGCAVMAKYANLWLALAYAPTDDAATLALNHPLESIDEVLYRHIEQAYAVFRASGSQSTQSYYATVARITKTLVSVPFFEIHEDLVDQEVPNARENVQRFRERRPECPLTSEGVVREDSLVHVEISDNTSGQVFCGILTSHTSRAKAIAVRDTWAGDCDGAVFFSDISEASIPSIRAGEDSYDTSWLKLQAVLHFINTNYLDDFDYFFLSSDQVYLIVPNLREYLASIESSSMYTGSSDPESGFVLTKDALESLVEALDSESLDVGAGLLEDMLNSQGIPQELSRLFYSGPPELSQEQVSPSSISFRLSKDTATRLTQTHTTLQCSHCFMD